jgi:hypothetical protein
LPLGSKRFVNGALVRPTGTSSNLAPARGKSPARGCRRQFDECLAADLDVGDCRFAFLVAHREGFGKAHRFGVEVQGHWRRGAASSILYEEFSPAVKSTTPSPPSWSDFHRALRRDDSGTRSLPGHSVPWPRRERPPAPRCFVPVSARPLPPPPIWLPVEPESSKMLPPTGQCKFRSQANPFPGFEHPSFHFSKCHTT